MNGFSRNKMRVSLLASAALGGLLAATPVMAQSNTAAAAPSSGGIETVMVTAQRRSEKNVNVPVAITAVSADQLKQAGITNLAGIQKVAPGVRFDSLGGYIQPSIRGIGTSVVSSGAGSNVGIYVDGFYSPEPQAANFSLLNVTGVQVLKGPQGTLFGYNSTGGAILVSTSDPSFDRHGMFDVSYGNYNTQRYQGYFTTGITDHIAFDIAGSLRKGDGFLKDIFTGNKKVGAYKNWTIRTGLKVELTDKISFVFRYEHSDINDPSSWLYDALVLNGTPQVMGAAWQAVNAAGGIPVPPPAPPGTTVQFPPTRFATGPHEVADAGRTVYRNKTNTYQLTGKFDLGFANLTSYTQYSSSSGGVYNYGLTFNSVQYNPASTYAFGYNVVPGALPAGSWLPVAEANLVNKNDRYFTQELLLNSESGGRLKWTAGAFYMDWTEPFQVSIRSPLAFPGLPLPPYPVYAVAPPVSLETVTGAVYVDGTYQLLNDLYLTAGVRYSHVELRHAHPQQPLPAGVPATLPTLKDNSFTPRAVIRYTPNDHSSVYFSYSRGYKAPMYNLTNVLSVGPANLTTFGTNVSPETLNAYEVGYKYAGRGMSFDLAAYYYDYSNLQISSYFSAAQTASYTYNAASARIFGLDAQANYDVTDNLNVNVGASYSNAKYQEFPGAAQFVLNPATGLLDPATVSLKNRPLQRAPKFTANLGARYTRPLFNGVFALSGNLYYTSSFYLDVGDQYKQSAYALLGLRAAWTDPSGMYTLAVYGNNVTNTNYLDSAYATQRGAGAGWGAPATYGVDLKVRF